MTSSKTIIALLLLISLSLLACTKKEKDNKFSSYLPVQVGNTWVYQVLSTTEFAIGKTDTQTLIITILKDTIIDNSGQSFVVEENRSGDKRNIIWQLKDGQLLRTGKYWIDDKILFKEKVTVGDTWIIDRNFGNGSNFDDTSFVAEQYENYPFNNANSPAYKIIRTWSPYGGKSRAEYTNYEIYIPYIGMAKAIYEYDIYSKHTETWTLTDYYTK